MVRSSSVARAGHANIHFSLDRRSALKGLIAAGAGGAALSACTAPADKTWAFAHGVASGDPAHDGFVIWTRVSPSSVNAPLRPVTGTWDVAEDERFTKILQSGAFATGPERDYTVKIELTDLPPGRRFAYRFQAGGITSPTGRAITLPEGDVESLRLALFSCANYTSGYFNAYRHCAARDDIDLAIHVGDYIYEYGSNEADGDRRVMPEYEIRTLADYRARYAHYREDPDLQEIHRRHTFITVWDDHEIANDSWIGGSEDQPADDASWKARRTAAVRAYFEWMPIRPLTPSQGGRSYRSFNYGNLASLIMLDTRLYGRDRQLQYDRDAPLIDDRRDWDQFRTILHDPERSILGNEQEAWLAEELKKSHGSKTKWRVLGQQTLMGLIAPPDPRPLLQSRGLDEAEDNAASLYTELAAESLPIYLDSFGGSYPAARARLLEKFIDHGGNTIVLSGDSHNAWACNLHTSAGIVAAVEVGCTSVTSPGLEAELPVDIAAAEKALVAKNPELAYCRLEGRGYAVITLTPETATTEWVYVSTVKSRSFRAEVGKRLTIARTENKGTAPFAMG